MDADVSAGDSGGQMSPQCTRATLEETVQADLLFHVVDTASPAREAQAAEVNKVLAERELKLTRIGVTLNALADRLPACISRPRAVRAMKVRKLRTPGDITVSSFAPIRS